jgi:hypothetical protein
MRGRRQHSPKSKVNKSISIFDSVTDSVITKLSHNAHGEQTYVEYMCSATINSLPHRRGRDQNDDMISNTAIRLYKTVRQDLQVLILRTIKTGLHTVADERGDTQ